MTDHLRPATARLLQADETARIAAVRAPRWISHPVANKAHVAMGMLLDQPASLRPRGLLLTGHYHSGKTMIAERFAVEHLRQAERQRVWVIQTREGAGLSHFYTSILSTSPACAHLRPQVGAACRGRANRWIIFWKA